MNTAQMKNATTIGRQPKPEISEHLDLAGTRENENDMEMCADP